MKINRQFQEQHVGEQAADWVLKQEIERDICLLYHQLARYAGIMDDLYYGSVFALRYWEFLDFQGVERDDRDFIRDGCLIMIFAMALECIGGSGSYFAPHADECWHQLEQAPAEDPDTKRLLEAVKLAVRRVREGSYDYTDPELLAAGAWAHRRYVRRYFIDRAEDFRNNPYFKS